MKHNYCRPEIVFTKLLHSDVLMVSDVVLDMDNLFGSSEEVWL